MITNALRRFDGQVALITGASRGIGLAVAHRLVSEGARVCITARKEPALREAVEGLGGPDVALAVAGSADDPGHQDAAIAACLAKFGRLDVLVNNSAINPHYGAMLEIDPTAAQKIFGVNVLAALQWIRKVKQASFRDGAGMVVNVGSVAGLAPAQGIGFYGSSKAALLHMTQQLAAELGPRIRVNAIAPAVVRTRFASVLYEGKEEAVVDRYALKRLGEPEDIAAAVAFLASADAAWITGQTLVVDGGITLSGGL